MNPITTSAELKTAIRQLELQQKYIFISLKEEFIRTQENFKLSNIIKSTFKAVVAVPDLKTDIINSAIGLSTGIVAKKILFGKTQNPFAKLLGVVLEVFVAGKISNNAANIKAISSSIVHKLFGKKETIKE